MADLTDREQFRASTAEILREKRGEHEAVLVPKADYEELCAALQYLHDDVADYLRLNNLGGYDNHAMLRARAALAKVRP